MVLAYLLYRLQYPIKMFIRRESFFLFQIRPAQSIYPTTSAGTRCCYRASALYMLFSFFK